MYVSGQIILVLVSIFFTAYQKIVYDEPFVTFDFLIFTLIAWLVGWQYDLARYYAAKAKLNETSYKQLIDLLPDTIYIHRDFKVIYANEAAVHLIGATSKKEVIGKSLLDFIVPEYHPRLMERDKQIKKQKLPIHTIEYKIKRFDGTLLFFEASSLEIVFGGKQAVLTIGKDITARKAETERILQKSEKLALLGQMAAGIAHEIRNPLTSIKGFIQLFQANYPQEKYTEIVLSELERINSIVGEFLVLAKPTAAVFAEQDVKILIKDVVTLINNQSMLNNVQIFVEFDRHLPMVSCEEKQIKQVLLNLLQNSIEAMPKGGNIDVRVKEKEEGKISIQIIDQGIGIPEERISTLGEPFYTTKEKGTGLGLMTCYKIIEGHNGKLNIESKLNEGTTIEIILPTITQPYLQRDMSHS
ncbi:two-component system sporulation sensor kinase A [Peribacillus deserti]|uniref:histidine kinase n=1 Tax=Peribacillus deserti TaxID=673318 RepID=A0ABS2QGZ2_9BACI|nr:ATP-binding protein [Peribacillus deserti]MBM7691763.1 two-component system sporulation sensor kinase A [Peribacillus deserti]